MQPPRLNFDFSVDRPLVTSSFSGPVLAHWVATHTNIYEIYIIDTGFLFNSTLEYAASLCDYLGLDLRRLTSLPSNTNPDESGVDACCQHRKVLTLERAIAAMNVNYWITGLRNTGDRKDVPMLDRASPTGIVKINPLAYLTDEDVDRYIADRDLPRHPLFDSGYESIGCWPCTAPGKGRQGRWPDTTKTECGLHQ